MHLAPNLTHSWRRNHQLLLFRDGQLGPSSHFTPTVLDLALEVLSDKTDLRWAGGLVASLDYKSLSISLLQNQPRDHSPDGDALRSDSAISEERGRSSA